MPRFALLLQKLDDQKQSEVVERHVTVTAGDGGKKELHGGRNDLEIGPFSGSAGRYHAELVEHNKDGTTFVSASHDITIGESPSPAAAGPGVLGVRLIPDKAA